MLLEQTVYLGTDNVIALALRSDIEIITHIADTQDDTIAQTHGHPTITRCVLRIMPIVGDSTDAQVTIDSNTQPTWFDFSEPTVLKMKIGGATINPGRHVTRISVYETGIVNGLVWGDIMLIVE
jgi:hypothetical protein